MWSLFRWVVTADRADQGRHAAPHPSVNGTNVLRLKGSSALSMASQMARQCHIGRVPYLRHVAKTVVPMATVPTARHVERGGPP